MQLKRALRNSKATGYIIPLSSPFQSPHHFNVLPVIVRAISVSARSFAVRCGDHLRFWDHLRFEIWGSFAVSGSFAALYDPQNIGEQFGTLSGFLRNTFLKGNGPKKKPRNIFGTR